MVVEVERMVSVKLPRIMPAGEIVAVDVSHAEYMDRACQRGEHSRESKNLVVLLCNVEHRI